MLGFNEIAIVGVVFVIILALAIMLWPDPESKHDIISPNAPAQTSLAHIESNPGQSTGVTYTGWRGVLCTQCLYQGKAKTIVSGSILIEVVLWLCFVVPGLVYSLWRSTSGARYRICPICRSRDIVPLKSPRAKRLLV